MISCSIKKDLVKSIQSACGGIGEDASVLSVDGILANKVYIRENLIDEVDMDLSGKIKKFKQVRFINYKVICIYATYIRLNIFTPHIYAIINMRNIYTTYIYAVI